MFTICCLFLFIYLNFPLNLPYWYVNTSLGWIFHYCCVRIAGLTVDTLVIFMLTYRRKPSASERLVVGLSFFEVSFSVCYIFVIVVGNVIGTDPTHLFTQNHSFQPIILYSDSAWFHRISSYSQPLLVGITEFEKFTSSRRLSTRDVWTT